MPWCGRSPNCWLSGCRAKVYMSCTASRPKPPRSAASHNLLKPCPSPARWSGPRRRRSKAEPWRLPRRQKRRPAPTELTGDRGPMVRIHLPPAKSRPRTSRAKSNPLSPGTEGSNPALSSRQSVSHGSWRAEVESHLGDDLLAARPEPLESRPYWRRAGTCISPTGTRTC